MTTSFKFNHLIPELSVSDLKKSLHFYVDILGFVIEYERPEEQFAYLSFQGSQLMLDQDSNNPKSPFSVGELKYPRGGGMHLQIDIDSLTPLLASLKKNKYPLKNPPTDYWFRQDEKYIGMRGILIMDPDGYLLMFNEDLGEKKAI